MTAAAWLGVGVLGGLGALARFAIDRAITRRTGGAFPVGILVVNLGGAFALGLLVGAGVHGDAYRLLGAGLLGAYTTFSTWMFDAHRLAGDGRRGAAALNVLASLALGLAAVWLGRRLGTAF